MVGGQGEGVIRAGQGVLAGLITVAVIVILAFGGFLIGTADSGPSVDQLPAPIVILPEATSAVKSPAPVPAPVPVPSS